MKTFLMICWRNIWRNKRRSLIVISSIAIGVFSMTISSGLFNGMLGQMVDNAIKTSLGHISINRKGFQDNMVLENSFVPSAEMIRSLDGSAATLMYAPRLKVQGMVKSSESSSGVLIMGIDPVREKRVSNIYDFTLKGPQANSFERYRGSSFLADPREDAILISRTMAEKLDLGIDDKLVIMLQDRSETITSYGLTVKGVFESPVSSFDKFVVFVGIDKLQQIAGVGKNISEISILTGNRETVDTVKQTLLKKIPDTGIEILTWKELAPYVVSMVNLFDNIMYIFYAVIFITVIFLVANTMIMAIMERFHEIGVMKSIGTRPRTIFFMVLIEAVNLGIVGLAAGLVLGLLFVWYFSITGIDLSLWAQSMKWWGTGSIIYTEIYVKDVIMSIVIVFLTNILASIFPAAKAARIKAIDALNYL